LTVPLHRVRNYEELEGGQGREVFFRPQRYRAVDLLPLQCEVVLALAAGERPGPLVDVSQNGAAFEWPGDLPVSVGDRIDALAVRFDSHEPYRGEARVGSVRDLNGTRVVGVSFEGPLLPIDGILELRAIKAFAQNGLPPALWRTPGHDQFKVLVSELRLYLEDTEPQLRRLESELPWHVLHGEGSPARAALIEKLRTTIAADILRASEEIDAASRDASPEHVQAMVQWSRRHLHALLMQAPSMHRAANKPFGYPGDYEVMRFIYEKPFEGPTLFAKSISLAFDQTRGACAVRHRKDLVKRELRRLMESKRRPVRVLAAACGPAQELLELFAEARERGLPVPVEIVLFDQDKGALAYAYRRLKPVIDPLQGRVKATYLHDSIKRLLRDANLFAEFGFFDLIYSVGLFDYLREATAVGLARNLVARLASGGRALIANMVPENPSRWYMEYHLDWFLNYRSHAQLLEIGARAAPGARLDILEEESRVNPFVEIQRD
jgi:extracellular factor (EF) 3-hydroxypalmitic acid methyl ester biosynthesis protein